MSDVKDRRPLTSKERKSLEKQRKNAAKQAEKYHKEKAKQDKRAKKEHVKNEKSFFKYILMNYRILCKKSEIWKFEYMSAGRPKPVGI